jgi:hypothetical protein
MAVNKKKERTIYHNFVIFCSLYFFLVNDFFSYLYRCASTLIFYVPDFLVIRILCF